MQGNNIRILTLGSDPEFFIVNSEGQPLSSIGLVGGSKENPKSLGDGFFVQEDNVALEINIPPASTREEFISSMINATSRGNSLLSGDKALSKSSSFTFPDSQLTGKGAREFGCDPDYSPWLMEVNNVECMKDGNFRSAGGHIHLGYTSDVGIDMDLSFAIAKALDLFIAVPSILIDKHGKDRRQFYGKNGALRLKEYGMEYRTVSNFWCFDRELIGWVWDNVHNAVQFLNSSGEEILDEKREEILSCINNDMVSIAKQLINEFAIHMPENSLVHERS